MVGAGGAESHRILGYRGASLVSQAISLLMFTDIFRLCSGKNIQPIIATFDCALSHSVRPQQVAKALGRYPIGLDKKQTTIKNCKSRKKNYNALESIL